MEFPSKWFKIKCSKDDPPMIYPENKISKKEVSDELEKDCISYEKIKFLAALNRRIPGGIADLIEYEKDSNIVDIYWEEKLLVTLTEENSVEITFTKYASFEEDPKGESTELHTYSSMNKEALDCIYECWNRMVFSEINE